MGENASELRAAADYFSRRDIADYQGPSESDRVMRLAIFMARHILATIPADDGEPVTIEYVVSRWKGIPEDASVEQWHWVTDQVFLRFREDRKWAACTPDSDPKSWHEFAVIETMDQLRFLLTVLGVAE